jgi:hypothetical protein
MAHTARADRRAAGVLRRDSRYVLSPCGRPGGLQQPSNGDVTRRSNHVDPPSFSTVDLGWIDPGSWNAASIPFPATMIWSWYSRPQGRCRSSSRTDGSNLLPRRAAACNSPLFLPRRFSSPCTPPFTGWVSPLRTRDGRLYRGRDDIFITSGSH